MENSITRRKVIAGVGSAIVFATFPQTIVAEENSAYEILMLNKDPNDPKRRMVFSPSILKINVGDTVKFIATDKSHNTESIKGMLPKDAEGWKGRLNEEVDIVLDKAGFYGYQCKPHANMGMIGLIIVEGDGKFDNLEEAKAVKHRGRSKNAWEKIWLEADKAGLTS